MSTSTWRTNNADKLRKYRREHYHRNREHYLQYVKEEKAKKRLEVLQSDELFQQYIKLHPTKVCGSCQKEFLTIEFPIHSSGGRRYPTYDCSTCQNDRRKGRKKINSDESKKRSRDRSRTKRRDPEFRASIIFSDCKTSDKKHGREFDLDVDFVEALIANGCVYCGDTANLMTLDRIDNTMGHTKANVNPACYRCNDLRSDMPYEAWMALTPTVKTIHEQGLFETWRFKGL
jgi:hypothetical protein